MTEDRDREEMQKLLAYANFSKVAEAIGVKRAAVANWAAGRHVTPARLEQVKALYGLPVASQGTQKEPPEPAWLGGLVREVRMNREAIREAMLGPGQPDDAALVEMVKSDLRPLFEGLAAQFRGEVRQLLAERFGETDED